METPTQIGQVTAARESTFEQLRRLFPAVEKAAQAAIAATVEHVESGSCVEGGESFLRSLGIEVPTEAHDVEMVVQFVGNVTMTRTVEMNVLVAASERGSGYGDAVLESAREDVDPYDIEAAIVGGANVSIDRYGDVEVTEAHLV